MDEILEITPLEMKRMKCIQEMKDNGTYALTNPEFKVSQWDETNITKHKRFRTLTYQPQVMYMKLKHYAKNEAPTVWWG